MREGHIKNKLIEGYCYFNNNYWVGRCNKVLTLSAGASSGGCRKGIIAPLPPSYGFACLLLLIIMIIILLVSSVTYGDEYPYPFMVIFLPQKFSVGNKHVSESPPPPPPPPRWAPFSGLAQCSARHFSILPPPPPPSKLPGAAPAYRVKCHLRYSRYFESSQQCAAE